MPDDDGRRRVGRIETLGDDRWRNEPRDRDGRRRERRIETLDGNGSGRDGQIGTLDGYRR